jgi:DNA-binding NarL/FixJ family response regulator
MSEPPSHSAEDRGASQPPTLLTAEELEVAVLLAAGYMERDIVTRTSFDLERVFELKSCVQQKLGLRDQSLLSRWAIEHKLLPRKRKS